MNAMILNYINGNLKDAKKQAKKFSRRAIATELEQNYGFSVIHANDIARWFKEEIDWNTLCDLLRE